MGDLVPVDRRPPEPRAADPAEIGGIGESRLTTKLFGGLCGVSRRHLDVLHEEPKPARRQPAAQLVYELRREIEEVASAPGVPITVADAREFLARRRRGEDNDALCLAVDVLNLGGEVLRRVLGDVAAVAYARDVVVGDLNRRAAHLPCEDGPGLADEIPYQPRRGSDMGKPG